ILHGGILNGDDLVEPATGNDKSANVLRQMAGKIDQVLSQREDLGDLRIRWINACSTRFFLADTFLRPAPERAGQRTHGVFREAENLANLANGTAAAIADHRRRDATTLTRIALVNILDDFFTSLMFEINIDIRRLASFSR